MRGKTILEALRLHELDELVQRVQAEGQVFDYELKLPDLSERWLRVNAAGISNSAGEREGTILVFHDLTRLKQLERTREEFVANVSHELRTPLSLIKGYVETLLDGARNNPEVAERFLKIIERNTQPAGSADPGFADDFRARIRADEIESAAGRTCTRSRKKFWATCTPGGKQTGRARERAARC